ncbi:toll-like receptor 13 isoform X3 [Trichoplusia ni]|uniref:Toll-like receptor 13 isoform X3 n=1 Tax=Trichoplusia ni TaxID=7111 RepID=A0A7E5W494_TRINI|nr:toll-like receptor 13 isoform X3 [Trichoplusia ni]
MTDVQDWVDEIGSLKPMKAEVKQHTDPSCPKEKCSNEDIIHSFDLSGTTNPVPTLHTLVNEIQRTSSPSNTVKYLSLARCQLTRIPHIFGFRDSEGRWLSDTLEYMSFYGNSFLGMSSDDQYTMTFNATGATEMKPEEGSYIGEMGGNIWSSGLASVKFNKLKELDLRACSIQTLGENVFQGMESLTALYLGENEINHIAATAFVGLNNLMHLDLSRNKAVDGDGKPKNLASDRYFVFQDLTGLVSLDLSHTKLTQRNLGMLVGLGKKFKNLSICESGLDSLLPNIFNTTSLEVLDISGNNGIMIYGDSLRGVEKTLKVVFARDIGLQDMETFRDFKKLEILQLAHNEISFIDASVVQTLKKLQVLDLNNNRLPAWFDKRFSYMPKLKLLALRNNNINIISEEMIEDVLNVHYLALSGNFIVCNCHAKDLFKMAYKNQVTRHSGLLKVPTTGMYHLGYAFYNNIIEDRMDMILNCDKHCLEDIEVSGYFKLVDYTPTSYTCLMVSESRSMLVANVTSCKRASREVDYDAELANGRLVLLLILIIPCVLLPVAGIYMFRRHLRYCFITMRNSAMLSIITKNETIVEGTVFNYDVFVSYCNEDRGWVLEHLLPHIEAECSVSACLHERDFQVGLSILENIVSCMDRSRSIMLIISQRFLLSHWCQFEMHLAQHRLLETRREDLTLVLLEDIPRRLRPNTLHYLMVTKTYIVWPKDEGERSLFWRRLKKTLISQKTKQVENVSLA